MRKSNSSLRACCACLDENGVWFVEYSYAILFYFDFNIKKITLAEIIPMERLKTEVSFFGMHVEKDDVYLIPNTAKNIYVFKKSKNKFITININEPCFGLFRETVKYGDALFCIPNFYENILKYDINSNNISYFSLGYSTEYLRKEGGVPSACSINQYVYILVYDSIIIFDMQLCDIVAVKKISNSRLTSIDVTQKNIFVFDANRCSLSVLDRVSLKKLKEIKFDCRSVKITCVYNGIVIVEDVIKAVRWFIDEQLNVICKEEYGSWLMENKASLYFSKWIKTKDRICEITPENHIILHNSNGKKECYNTDGMELFREKVKEYIIKCNNTSDVINEVFSENDILKLPFFLDTLLCL